MPEDPSHDKTRAMLSRPLRARAGRPPSVRLWGCCAFIVSAGLSACGGRAADGLESIEGDPDPSTPETQSPGSSNIRDQQPFRPVRETCEDNPLLAGCPYASGGSNRPSPPDEPPEEEPGPPEEEESLPVAAARNVLVSYCGACHSSVLTADQASARINYIDDWNQLIEAGLIVECQPERSRIIEVMRTGEMPPPVSGAPPVTEAEIGFVESAIEFGCRR